LSSLNDKIGVYKRIFYTRTPRFEKAFIERKRERLEELMRKEQKELENFMMPEAKATLKKHGGLVGLVPDGRWAGLGAALKA
jgi:hypothetical protein